MFTRKNIAEENILLTSLNFKSLDVQALKIFSCEEKDRTSDLRVMSPTSYRCSTSRCKDKSKRLCSQKKFDLNAKDFLILLFNTACPACFYIGNRGCTHISYAACTGSFGLNILTHIDLYI